MHARGTGSARFEGRVAIVSGASTDPGIGMATARRLAREGASVLLNARAPARLEAAVGTLRSEGLPVLGVPGSPGDPHVAEMIVGTAVREFGGVDFVVSAVGGAPHPGSGLEVSRDALLATMELNTWPTVALVQEAVKQSLAARRGAIVNISSGSPRKATPSAFAYAASKAALNAMTRTFANDLARRGVRVNAVCPGLTKTEGTRAMWEGDDGRGLGARLPLGRLTDADDVADAVAFLLSDEARQITGVLLDVDAGNHLVSGGVTFAELGDDDRGRDDV